MQIDYVMDSVHSYVFTRMLHAAVLPCICNYARLARICAEGPDRICLGVRGQHQKIA